MRIGNTDVGLREEHGGVRGTVRGWLGRRNRAMLGGISRSSSHTFIRPHRSGIVRRTSMLIAADDGLAETLGWEHLIIRTVKSAESENIPCKATVHTGDQGVSYHCRSPAASCSDLQEWSAPDALCGTLSHLLSS